MSGRVDQKKSSSQDCPLHNPRLTVPPMEYIDLTQDVPIFQSNIRRSRTINPELMDSVIIDDNLLDDNESDEIIHLDTPSYSSKEEVGWFVDDSTSEKSPLTCPICLENLTSKRQPTSTKCGHIFCATCIEEAIKATKKCPSCQVTAKWKNCTRLYF